MTIQGALNDLSNLINSSDIPMYYKPSLEKIKETIELEMQPKIGEWIKTFEPNEAEPFVLWECSNCHKTVRGNMKSDYCPNCGADMKKKRG